jgi:hypothetical protein
MAGWKNMQPRTLRKVVYAMNEHKLNKNIEAHEERGWKQASEVREHGYGFGVLMEFSRRKEEPA